MWEPLTAQGKHGKPRLQWIEMAILGRRRWRYWGGDSQEGYSYSTCTCAEAAAVVIQLAHHG